MHVNQPAGPERAGDSAVECKPRGEGVAVHVNLRGLEPHLHPNTGLPLQNPEFVRTGVHVPGIEDANVMRRVDDSSWWRLGLFRQVHPPRGFQGRRGLREVPVVVQEGNYRLRRTGVLE